MGRWVKYDQNYLYLCPFLGTHLQVRPVDGFSRIVAQTTRTRAKMCLLGIFFTSLPFMGSQTPKPQFWGVNRLLQAKLAKNVHIIKTTASIPTKFCKVIKVTKCSLWVVPTHALQIKMEDGRHLGKIEKSPYIGRRLSDFDEI